MPSKCSLDAEGATSARTAYDALCASYHAIDGFRGQLLGFLPLASGGLFLFANKPDEAEPDGTFSLLFGVFGFLITLGLFIFEIYGIRRCTHLMILGRHLERQLNVAGQFGYRPDGLSRSSRGHFSRFINEPLASGVIYPAVGAAWLFLAFHGVDRWLATWIALGTFAVGFGASYGFNRWLADVDFPAAERKRMESTGLFDLAVRMGEAEKSRDTAFFRALLADNLTFRRANKSVVDKATFLQDLANPENTYDLLESENISARVCEGVAVMTLLVRAKGMRAGKPFAGVFRNIRTFVHEPDHVEQPWQLHAWFNVRVLDS